MPKKPCSLGSACPYQHEHQHTAEFSHDGPPKPPPRARKFADAGPGRRLGGGGGLGGAHAGGLGGLGGPPHPASPPRKRRRPARKAAAEAARARSERASGGLRTVRGDLLDAPAGSVIVHQCNCVTSRARGLAAAIFARWPAADVYRLRAGARSSPGTIDVSWVDGGRRRVVAMFAQVQPGQPRGAADSARRRLEWFERCLDAVARMSPRPPRVAAPHLVGCGLAGGCWGDYERSLRAFAARSGIDVLLYQQAEPQGGGGGGAGPPARPPRRPPPSGGSAGDAIVID